MQEPTHTEGPGALQEVIERGRIDPAFRQRLLEDPKSAVREAGFQLGEQEMNALLQMLSAAAAPPMDPEFQVAEMKRRISFLNQRAEDLGNYTVSILKTTLNNAAGTYKAISLMYKVMFFVGIALFVGAAIYGAISKEKVTAFVFGGLGVGTFVATFLTGPIEKSQSALSNLVQVEISFMDYFEQITFWESYALTPQGMPPAPSLANIEKASEMLQVRSKETIELLQKYVEPAPAKP